MEGIYLIVNFMLMLTLAVIWSKDSWANSLLKVVFTFMTTWTGLILMHSMGIVEIAGMRIF